MGRLKKFDQTQVLNKITKVFWAQGFQSTSLNDLTQATGLAKMSLYHSYGNKEEMFVKALKSFKENVRLKWQNKTEGLDFIEEFLNP